MYLMGIDIGTSSAKTIVTTEKGVLVAEQQQSYQIQEPQPGYRVQDADEVLQAIINTVNKAYNALPAKTQLAGIGFSAAMHSFMVVDENCKPLTQLMLWADTRSIDQAEQLKNSALANDLYENCGVPIHPMTPLCKILWLKQNEPDLFKKAHKFISIKEYLFYYLAGVYAVDFSIASATGLFNIHKLQWHLPALDIAGINVNKLSTPVDVFRTFNLKKEAADKLDVPADTPLIIGSSDGCLANIGSGVQQSGDVAVTISTSMAVRITSSSPHPDEGQTLFNYAVQPDQYVCGGGSNNGSLLLHWLSQSILKDEKLADPAEFMKLALTAPAGCEGLIFLPYLLGERAPVWDANATGVITGFQFHHQQQHLMRALVEGLTMNAFVIVEKLQNLTGRIKNIKASGGFTNSKQWVQMLADISNLPVSVNNTADASALGAVIVAGYALKVYDSLSPAMLSQTDNEVYQPDELLHKVYAANFSVFKTLYQKNKLTLNT